LVHFNLQIGEIEANLDKVPCKTPLYGTRLFALQLLTGKSIESIINVKIIFPLTDLTLLRRSDVIKDYSLCKFSLEGVSPSFYDNPNDTLPTWARQFIRDINVYGLRGAIIDFNTYEFLSDPTSLVNDSIKVYHYIATLYTENMEKLKNSKNSVIKNLIHAAQLYDGEENEDDLASALMKFLKDQTRLTK
jgi:hypothetical protein